jgi:hypothetical protein
LKVVGSNAAPATKSERRSEKRWLFLRRDFPGSEEELRWLGAPTASFAVLGATPQRDSPVIGFSARTNIADSTQLYLRYDGEVGGGTDNHALNVGVRLTW